MPARRAASLFAPLRSTGRLRRPVERVIAVITKPNPSFDYYLEPRLRAPGMPPVEVRTVFSSPREVPPERFDGALVLFCRYMSGAWLSAVEAASDRIAGVGYFIDDDLDALFADAAVPLTYKLWIFRLALRHRRRLSRQLDLVFTSSEHIGDRHGLGDVRLLGPVAGALDAAPPAREPDGRLRLAFHSTGVHAREHRWLSGVMAAVMAAEPGLTLEVVAGSHLRGLWRTLPRTVVHAPLSWPDYRAWTRRHGTDLLLAPLLPNSGNMSRSPTKRIEAMRLGAALLVSDLGVYRPSAEERALGMHVAPDPEAWRQALHALAGDHDRLWRLRELNRRTVAAASAGLEPLLTPEEIEGAPPRPRHEPVAITDDTRAL